MGTSVKIGGYDFYGVREYSIQEDSTPLSASDTTGATGSLSLTINAPDPNLEYTQPTGAKWILDYGHDILSGKDVILKDSRYGTISGRVSAVSKPSPATISLQVAVKQNRLNAFNVRAQPFSGTLGNLIRYYVGLAMPGETVSVESSLNSRSVAVPGWQGELWYYLKMLAMAHEFEIAAVNDVLTFRRLRQRDLPKGLDTTRAGDSPVPNLAQAIEVYRYNNEAITNKLVYPPEGWTPSTEVLNVNAGELAEYTLELSASVSSIQTPTFETFVSPDHDSSSVFTIVANDNLPVSLSQWTGSGGSLRIRINEDTTSLTISLRGPTRVPVSTGGFASNFAVALAADSSRYSTLRIVGTGVKFKKEKTKIRTGATAAQTGTPIGVTIDNPFLSDKNQQYRAGLKAASDFAIPVPSRNAAMTTPAIPGPVLGNVGGARVWDRETKRYYRVRSATITPGISTTNAEDDLLHDDVEAFRTGKTYAGVQMPRNGLTYQDDFLMGLR
jgi:hypothetical protein